MNVTKSTVSYEFDYIYWRNLELKTLFFCSNMHSIQKFFYKISQNILKKRCGGVCFS